jgi:hypothetical protein
MCIVIGTDEQPRLPPLIDGSSDMRTWLLRMGLEFVECNRACAVSSIILLIQYKITKTPTKGTRTR